MINWWHIYQAPADGTGAGGGGATGNASGAAGATGEGGAGGTGAGTAGGSGTAAGANAGGADNGAGGGATGAASTGAATSPWGDNWRETYAGQDEKRLNVLKRYAGPKDALDALFAARQRIDSGEVKNPLPENATPEQIAAFRQERGIPDKAEGYLANLPEGMHFDDQDKAMLGDYLSTMHELNLPPATVHKLLQTRAAQLDKMMEGVQQADAQTRTQVEDSLRAEWGGDYRANLNGIHALLDTGPAGIKDEILQARLPDGRALFNSPDIIRFFAGLSRQLNPTHTLVAADGGTMDGKGVEGRIAELDKMMGAPRGSDAYKGYWDNPKVQEEYRNLITARERIKAMGAGR